MAPIALASTPSYPVNASQLKNASPDGPVDLNIFPDGIKTSGAHPPLPELIVPYEEWPKHVDGPTLWKAEDYAEHPERWTKSFDPEEIAELSAAADAYIASSAPLTGITKASLYSSLGGDDKTRMGS